MEESDARNCDGNATRGETGWEAKSLGAYIHSLPMTAPAYERRRRAYLAKQA